MLKALSTVDAEHICIKSIGDCAIQNNLTVDVQINGLSVELDKEGNVMCDIDACLGKQ